MRLSVEFRDAVIARLTPTLAKDIQEWKGPRHALVIILHIVSEQEANASMPAGTLLASMADRFNAAVMLRKIDRQLAAEVAEAAPDGEFWIVVTSNRMAAKKAVKWPEEKTT